MLGCLLVVWACVTSGQARAQGEAWEQPDNISQSPYDSLYPSVVVDPEGNVHVVWCESIDADKCNTIFYAAYDGTRWSPPIDIVAARTGESADVPRLGIDALGTLHMVWVGNASNQIFYSSAYARTAGSARGWHTPTAVTDPTPSTRYPDLAVDTAGNLHVVYTIGGGVSSGVYYSHLLRGSASWSQPRPVFTVGRSDRLVDKARLAVDEGGAVHVVWTEYDFPEVFPPLGIRYARSTDGGSTWSEPYLIDGVYDNSAIATLGTEQVHVVWSGTSPDRHEFHMWSADRGVTWSSIGQTTPLGGYFGLPSIAADSAGHVHLLHVTSLEDIPLVHQSWAGRGWSEPVPLVTMVEGAPNHPSDSDIAVGLGNELHGVVEHMIQRTAGPAGAGGWQYDIFYLHSVVDAPRLEPQRLVEPTAVLPQTVTGLPTRTTEAVQVLPTVFVAADPIAVSPRMGSEPTFAVLAGVLPALLLVGGVYITCLLWKKLR